MNQWTLLAEVAHSLTMTGYGLDVCVLWSEDPRSVRKPMETWQTVFFMCVGYSLLNYTCTKKNLLMKRVQNVVELIS